MTGNRRNFTLQLGAQQHLRPKPRGWKYFQRRATRDRHHDEYAINGLNGLQAAARRKRQIERGQLKAENGLVA